MADDGTGFDWSQLPDNPGDPMAGSDYTDVSGQAPLDSTPFGTNDQVDAGGLPTGAATSGFSIQQLLAQLAQKGQSGLPKINLPGTNPLANLGSTTGSLANTIQGNRITQGNFTQGYDKLMLDAQDARNKTESDALKKLAQTSYIAQGGSAFKPPALSLNGRTIQTPDLGFGPRPTSDAEKAGATSLQSQLQARLSPGGTYTPQPLSGYGTPGTGETLATGTSAGLSSAGALLQALGLGGRSQPPISENLPSSQSPMTQPIPGQPGKFATSSDGGKTWTES